MRPIAKSSNRQKSIEGRYANYFKIGYNAFEFIIDFGQLYENDTDGETIHSRIITSPAYAKSLFKILKGALDGYEQKYRPISEDK